MIYIKSEDEIKVLRESGKILKFILDELKKIAGVGANLIDLEKKTQELLKQKNAQAAFLGYQPEGADYAYPAAICVSVNDVVVHGVPLNYILKSGDVLKIDMGVIFKGLISDSAITIIIGKSSPKVRKLLDSTKKALEEAIKVCKIGKTIGDIGYVIEKQAKKDGFKVLKGLTGHGVGYEVHEDPVVFNYGHKSSGLKLKEGMVIAIEPMFSIGSEGIVQNKDESYSSADRSLTAHFEHTIAITKNGPIVLTE